MVPSSDELHCAAWWAATLRGEGGPDVPPVSFMYAGVPVTDLRDGWTVAREAADAGEGVKRQTTRFTDSATGLEVRVDANVHADFPAVEWVVHLHNTGQQDTPLIECLQALDALLPLAAAQSCVVHYADGATCVEQDFAPRSRDLRPRASLRLQPGGGRSSSEVLPFFCVDTGGGGFMLAVGWTGEWATQFDRPEAEKLRVRAGMDHTRFVLHPGEEVRTPRILVLAWSGDRWRGHNLLRRFVLQHHRPRVNGRPLVGPLCNGNWGGTPAAVHLDNIRHIIEHDLPFEVYWIDAEWFGGSGSWGQNAGDWTPRAELYPEGFRPISDLLHESGRGLLLWFEPERVAPGTPWARDHAEWLLEVPPGVAITWADYGEHMSQAEWVLAESHRNQLNADDRLFNLGDPEARRFLTDFLSQRITEFGLDWLRWDSNIAQLPYWRHADAPDRQGITEIRYVEGQYALWDELLQRHPGLAIDNCASGGRRMDLESISRTTPLWRTDYVAPARNIAAAQCHTVGLHPWVPLNGTGGGYLKDWDEYVLRSTMSSTLVCGLWGQGDATQGTIPDDYPFEHAKQLLQQYLAVREYYHGDFYPLTEHTLADDAWMAYQLDRPEEGDGIVVVLKRPHSPFMAASLPLQALQAEAEYAVEDADRGTVLQVSGKELLGEGLRVELRGRPDSALLRYSVASRLPG